LNQIDRQRLAAALERDDAGVVSLPLDRDAGRGQDVNDGVRHFRTNAVAGDERDRVCHSRTYQTSIAKPIAMFSVRSVSVDARPANDEAAAIASMASARPARTKNARGGGPRNFIAIRPASIVPAQA